LKAIVFDQTLQLKELPEPQPQPGEAVIQVQLAGICNTDLEILNGYMNFTGILGHEFVGIVERVHGESSSWVGKRVVGEINLGCGTCEYCLKGLQRHCPKRTVLGIFNRSGAFAEKVALPVGNLLEVPNSISDEAAVFVEPLAACFEIFEQIQLKPDAPVAIIGDGKLGLLLAQTFLLHGADVTVVGKHFEKLELAAGWGCKTCLSDAAPRRRFPVVVEASGNASGFHLALDLLEPRGTLVLKSTYHGELAFNAARVVVDEITIVGSRCGKFGPALRALSQHRVVVQPLISKIFSINNFRNAFALAQSGGNLKILLKIQ
jgi:threonine dehydrogenase-like Zn-dependent dehydrogenase